MVGQEMYVIKCVDAYGLRLIMLRISTTIERSFIDTAESREVWATWREMQTLLLSIAHYSIY